MTAPERIRVCSDLHQWTRGSGEWMNSYWGLPTEIPYIRADLVEARAAEAVAKEREQVVNIVQQSAEDARDVFSDVPEAKDAVDYMEQMIYAAIRAVKGE